MTPFFGSAFWLLVTLGVLVTFHEFGHYWVARRCGVKVLRFSVGFGRALWKRTGRDGTEYWIAAIPLGGYVKMLDAREGPVDPALRGQEFTAKPVWQRIAIVAAGPGFNLLFTVLAFWAMFMLGRPDVAPVVGATPHSLAAEAGIRSGDRIVSVNGQPASDFVAFGELVQAQAAKSPRLAVVVQRGAQAVPLTVTAHWQSLGGQPPKWVLGVGAPAAEAVTVHYGPFKAMNAALATTWRNTAQTFHMLTKMVSGETSTRNLSGVIGIASVANASANMGLPWFLQFLALVSLSLAILNLLPIPILDGGHLLYYLVELVKGRPVSEQTMIVGQYIGMTLLFALMGLAFYNDIQRLLLS